MGVLAQRPAPGDLGSHLSLWPCYPQPAWGAATLRAAPLCSGLLGAKAVGCPLTCSHRPSPVRE